MLVISLEGIRLPSDFNARSDYTTGFGTIVRNGKSALSE
jgi:hypothetical protein